MDDQLRPDLLPSHDDALTVRAAPLHVRRREPSPRPSSSREELGPALFATPLVTVGRWRCPADCAVFTDSGPARAHLFFFPRTSVWVEHEGGRRFVADPTVVTFYNAGQRYRRYPLSPDGDRGEWFAVDRRVAEEILAAWDPDAPARGSQLFPFTHGPSDRVSYLWQRAVFEHVCRTVQPDALLVEESMLAVLERVVASAHGRLVRPPLGPRDHDRVDAAQSLLAKRFPDPLGLHDLAAYAGCSAFHLARVFRQLTGHSLHGYRTELRLRSALDSLASGASDLVTLALALGYSSHSHFTSVFRQAFGLTPSEVRVRLTAGRARELVSPRCTARH
jgi:AraC-like DNA-binding protein